MFDFFSKDKDFKCVICGNTDSNGNKKTIHGRICLDCLNKLNERGLNNKTINLFTTDQAIKLCKDRLTPDEVDDMFVIDNPPILLDEGEKCYYVGQAQGGKVKTVSTGYSGKRNGMSVRISKGVSVHTGGAAGQISREQIMELSALGTFIMTNTRFILQTTQYGFELGGKKSKQLIS